MSYESSFGQIPEVIDYSDPLSSMMGTANTHRPSEVRGRVAAGELIELLAGNPRPYSPHDLDGVDATSLQTGTQFVHEPGYRYY